MAGCCLIFVTGSETGGWMGIKTEAQNLFDRYQSVYRQADAKGCAAMFTSDARLFSPFGTALGRQAIEHLHGEWLEKAARAKHLLFSMLVNPVIWVGALSSIRMTTYQSKESH